MYANWTSTQFWFSVSVLTAATFLCGYRIIDGAQWMIAVSAAIALFGGRKIAEHAGKKPPGGQ